MFREHWRERGFWRWWWREKAPFGLRMGVAVTLLGLVLGAGVFAAGRLTSATAGLAATGSYLIETTVDKVVTVREKGRVVRKVVPVVKRVFLKRVVLKPSTAYETKTSFATHYITTPGHVRVVRKPVVRYVPVVKKRVVTIAGKTHTVAVTRLVPTTKVVTQTQTSQVTNQQTVTSTHVTTQKQVVTQTQSVTDTQTQTVTSTQTETEVETVTVPTTVPTTVTTTVTTIVTTTVTVPATTTG
jgi:hypothetical protein